MTQKNGNYLVLMAKVHAGTKYIAQNLLLVAQSSSVEGCTGSCPFVAVEYGCTDGNEPATCETCGKIFPRPKVALPDPSPARGKGIKGNRSRNSSPAMSRKSSVVSWNGRPCEQLETSSPPSEQSAPLLATLRKQWCWMTHRAPGSPESWK